MSDSAARLQCPEPSAAPEALASAAQRGCVACRDALYTRFQPLIGAAASRSAPHERADALQQSALEFLQLVQEYDTTSRVGFAHYAKTKLHWRVANYLRSARRPQQVEELGADPPELAQDGPEPDGLAVRAALDGLDARRRDLIIRWYWHEETADSIAASLGVTPRAVRAMRQRAERRLGELLGGSTPDRPSSDDTRVA